MAKKKISAQKNKKKKTHKNKKPKKSLLLGIEEDIFGSGSYVFSEGITPSDTDVTFTPDR